METKGRSRQGNHSIRGLTLIELLWVTALFALLMTMGVPSLLRFVERQQADSASGSFQDFLAFARTEALVRGRSLVMCPRRPGTTQCDSRAVADDAEEAALWRQGWVLFVDHDGNPLSVGREDLVLRVQEALDEDIGLQLGGNTGPGQLQYIRLTRSGSSFPINPSVLFCLRDNSGVYYANRLMVFRGRTRLADPDEARGLCNDAG